MGRFNLIKEKCEFSEALTVFRLKGNLDVDHVQTLAKAFNGAIENENLFIIAEMGEVAFISSPMFGELMGCKKRLVEKGGNLYLAGLKTDTRNKLRQMGADKIFDFFQTIRSAVSKYRWEIENEGDPFDVSIPPHLEYVPELRNLFSRLVLLRGYSRRDAFRIETIIDELCNNAIEHGEAGNTSSVRVKGQVFRYKVELTIANHQATPAGAETQVGRIQKRISGHAPFNLNEKRGRGLELVKMLCQEMKVATEGSQTLVKVLKRKEV